MAIIPLNEYADRLGKNRMVVYQKALRGGFKTAFKFGNQWAIDENEPYIDNRVKSGRYRDWREKYPNRNEQDKKEDE